MNKKWNRKRHQNSILSQTACEAKSRKVFQKRKIHHIKKKFQKSFSLLRKESFANVYMVNSYLITQLQSFFFLASFRDCMYDYISAEGHEVWPYVVLGSESGLSVTSSPSVRSLLLWLEIWYSAEQEFLSLLPFSTFFLIEHLCFLHSCWGKIFSLCRLPSLEFTFMMDTSKAHSCILSLYKPI